MNDASEAALLILKEEGACTLCGAFARLHPEVGNSEKWEISAL